MSTDVTELRDHAEITNTLNAMAWCQDRRTWDGLDKVLADHVAIQYAGQEKPATVDRANLVSSWRAPLEALDASQHILTGFIIDLDGDRASVTLNENVCLYDQEVPGGATYRFGTYMNATLRRLAQGWRIVALEVTPVWSEGNAAFLRDWQPPRG